MKQYKLERHGIQEKSFLYQRFFEFDQSFEKKKQNQNGSSRRLALFLSFFPVKRHHS